MIREQPRTPLTCMLVLAAGLVATLGTVPTARAGARILCDVIDIGDAPSLPWGAGQGWNLPSRDFSAERLVPETLRLLGPGTPVLVRMETLRRATIYARSFAGTSVGRELAWRLLARALEAEAKGKPDPLAWFDAGYFAESLEHWDPEWVRRVDGYSFVVRASALRGIDPEMELAAMILVGERPEKPGRHFEKVRAGRQKDPKLARSIAAVFPRSADR